MTDRLTVRMVVAALAIAVITGICFMGYLSVIEKPIPDPLDRTITLLAGGLIAVLSSTRSVPPSAESNNGQASVPAHAILTVEDHT